MQPNPFAEADKNTVSIAKSTTQNLEEDVKDYICPISGDIFADPVVLSNGRSYERECAVRLLAGNEPVDPVTREKLDKNIMIPNRSLKQLTLKFLERHPEFKKNVYSPNPITQAIEKSLSFPDANFDQTLLNIINDNPEALTKIDFNDLSHLVRMAYKIQYVTFFAILNQLKIPGLREIAVQLMTTPIDPSPLTSPNVFYTLATLEEFPVTYFYIAMEFIGVKESLNIFYQRHPNWPTVFQAFWMNTHYTLGKKILDLYLNEDRKFHLESEIKVIDSSPDEDNEEDNNKDYHTHSYTCLLQLMLLRHDNHEDITETLELMKMECPEQIEKILLQQLPRQYGSCTLLQWVLTKGMIENGIMLAELCSQEVINDTVLKPCSDIQRSTESVPNNSGTGIAVSLNHNTVTNEYANSIHRAFANNRNPRGLELLKLLKTDAAQALLCPWECKARINTKNYALSIPNAIQWLYLNGQTNACTEIEREGILNHEQILTAMTEKRANNWTIFDIAIIFRSLTVLQNCISLLGREKSRQLLLNIATYNATDVEKFAGSCIHQTIRIYNRSTTDKDIIRLIITTLGDKINELLTIIPDQEHIFTSLCIVNNQELTELILNHFENIDLLINAIKALKSSRNIPLRAIHKFTEALIRRLISILKSEKQGNCNLGDLIRFAIFCRSFDLLEFTLTLSTPEQNKNLLLQTATSMYGQYKFNALTMVLISSTTSSAVLDINNTINIIKIIIATLKDKALEALRTPYTPNRNFLNALIIMPFDALYPIIIGIFENKEDLQETLKTVHSLYDCSASKKLIAVIEKRIGEIKSIAESAVTQNSFVESTIPSAATTVGESAIPSVTATIGEPAMPSIVSPIPPTTTLSLTTPSLQQPQNVTETQLVALSLPRTLNPAASTIQQSTKIDDATDLARSMDNPTEIRTQITSRGRS